MAYCLRGFCEHKEQCLFAKCACYQICKCILVGVRLCKTSTRTRVKLFALPRSVCRDDEHPCYTTPLTAVCSTRGGYCRIRNIV